MLSDCKTFASGEWRESVGCLWLSWGLGDWGALSGLVFTFPYHRDPDSQTTIAHLLCAQPSV